MPDDPVKHSAELDAAINIVLAFVDRMNDWEPRRYRTQRPDRVAELEREYYDIIEQFCTKRKRAYGGHPHSWSPVGEFAGVTRDTIVEAELVKPRRIEIVAKNVRLPEKYFKFVLFKRGGRWLLDNLLSRLAISQSPEFSRDYF